MKINFYARESKRTIFSSFMPLEAQQLYLVPHQELLYKNGENALNKGKMQLQVL